jgi:hypothetical protein
MTTVIAVRKLCIDCGCRKALDQFPNCAATKDGKHSYCNACNRARVRKWYAENQDKVQAYNATNRERVSARVRSNKLLRDFGITPERYEDMVAQQHGCCAICGGEPGRRALAVDHCHKTGQVRGLLCDSCNKALGFVKDNVETLFAMIVYLETSVALCQR